MGKSLKKIGWLQPGSEFSKGDVPEDIFEKIVAILQKERVNLLRTVKSCSLCNDKEWKYADDKKTILLGCSELLIPTLDDSTAFSAPDLIIHYIAVHNFLPSEDFIEAVERLDLKSDWSGNLFFNEVTNISR